MSDLFKNKYRVSTARMQTWNYGGTASYFITINTKNQRHFFGKVVNGKMNLSTIGRAAHDCWLDIPKHFPFVKLDEFVIMPNHMHGIIIINKDQTSRVTNHNIKTQDFASPLAKQDFASPLAKQNIAFPPSKQNAASLDTKNKFGPQSKNLASVIRGYKVGVTKIAKHLHPDWAWQPRYYDSIIFKPSSIYPIRNYIKNNPTKWQAKYGG